MMGVRQAVRRAARQVMSAVQGRIPGLPGGRTTLSVVVDGSQAGDQLRACLESVLASTATRPEIVLLAPAPRARQIAAELADPLIRLAADSWPQAVRGRYVTFCGAEDTVPRKGYVTLIASLNQTGSDFAVGAARRNRFGRRSRVPGTAAAHTADRLGVTLETVPEAVGDLVPGNRAFRTEFARAVLPETVPDSEALVRAYLRARAFDLLTATTYEQRIASEITAGLEEQGDNLEDWIRSTGSICSILDAEATPAVRSAWLARVLDVELSDFVPYTASHDRAYAERLRQAVLELFSGADAATLARVRVERKLLLELVARGDWDDADRLREYVRLNGSPPPTRVVDGRVLAELPVLTDVEWPDALLELGEQQTPLSAGVQRVRWSERYVSIEGWAYIAGVDLTDRAPRLRLWLEELTSGVEIALEARSRVDPTITRLANRPNHRYDHAGFTAILDWWSLPPDDDWSSNWQLRAEVEIDGVTREGAVRGVLRNGMADLFGVSPVREPTEPDRLVAVLDPSDGLVFRWRTDGLRAVALGEADGQLTGQVRVLTGSERPPDELLLVRRGHTVATAAVAPTADGLIEFSLPMPESSEDGLLELRLSGPDRDRQRVSWPADAPAELAAGSARWVCSVRGNVQLDLRPRRWTAESVEVTDDAIMIRISATGWSADDLAAVVLRGPETVPTEADVAGSIATLRIATSAPGRWTDTTRPLPSGDYQLVIGAGTPAEDQLAITPGLLATLPEEVLTATHRVQVARTGESLTLTFGPPLSDDELGWVARRRLAEQYRQTTYAPSDQVYFQCYRGEFATDSQRAIHEELRRRGSALELVWGVADLSVVLPAGARPVIIGSRAWYEVIGRARYLCSNVDFDRFFRRRENQRFLQTFHGYPFKSMGVSFWRAKNFSEPLLAYECDRRNAAWTSILVPAPFCEQLYRTEYRYTGEVLVTGYPRDDVLARGDDEARSRTRTRLGIGAETTAVLYAPTWRESAATSSWTAAAFDQLDLDALSSALGPGFVVLSRGHHFTRGTSSTASEAAAVLDVTDYPEINDLVLAADVAILDYSSLRFDWLLTGKPMIFFVPDREEYLGQRTALFDYGPTAPGPWLSTTDEVVAALHDLDRVDLDYATARRTADEEFNGLNDGEATRRVVDAFFDRSDLTG